MILPRAHRASAPNNREVGADAPDSPLSDTLTPVSIPRKLGFKPGMVCAVIDPPAGMKHGLPASTASEPELILAFASDRASLGRSAARALDLYGVGGRLWFAYPKKGGPVRSDLDRDHGWEPLTQTGSRRTPCCCTRLVISSPATTRVSLLARAMSLPARMAATVGSSPA